MEAYEVILPGAQLKKLLEKKSKPIIEKYDLRVVELDILVLLFQSRHGDTAKDIINSKHISKAHVSKSIDNLKMRRFIELNEDAEDRRILHIELTDKARTVVKEVLDVYSSCKQIMFHNITDEERIIVERLLRKISENICHELSEE